jgi:hypothetical protein
MLFSKDEARRVAANIAKLPVGSKNEAQNNNERATSAVRLGASGTACNRLLDFSRRSFARGAPHARGSSNCLVFTVPTRRGVVKSSPPIRRGGLRYYLYCRSFLVSKRRYFDLCFAWQASVQRIMQFALLPAADPGSQRLVRHQLLQSTPTTMLIAVAIKSTRSILSSLGAKILSKSESPSSTVTAWLRPPRPDSSDKETRGKRLPAARCDLWLPLSPTLAQPAARPLAMRREC